MSSSRDTFFNLLTNYFAHKNANFQPANCIKIIVFFMLGFAFKIFKGWTHFLENKPSLHPRLLINIKENVFKIEEALKLETLP